MRTKIFGEQTDTIVIEHYNSAFTTEIKCPNSIVKLWLSDGTILGIKYGKNSMLYPNIWHIRALKQGNAKFNYTPCYNETHLNYSDIFEIDAEINDYEVTPRTCYIGDDINDVV